MEATPVPDDPLMPLYVAGVTRLIEAERMWPLTFVIGDVWVVYGGSDKWLIGPDEPATTDQVRELMVLAGGVFEVTDY